MRNQLKLNKSKEIIAFLSQCFPQVFFLHGKVKPLKIGIFQEIVKRIADKTNISKTQLRYALRIYTSSWRYLYSIKKGARRIDLDGNDSEFVDRYHIAYAEQKLRCAKLRIQMQVTSQLCNMDKIKPHNTSHLSSKSFGRKCVIQNPAIQKSFFKYNDGNIDISLLKVGQHIKVIIGKNTLNATIIEVLKRGVKAQLSSNLIMIIGTKYLLL